MPPYLSIKSVISSSFFDHRFSYNAYHLNSYRPISAQVKRNLTSSSSSMPDRYGDGPDLGMWTTFPDSLSLNVVLGTSNSSAALSTPNKL